MKPFARNLLVIVYDVIIILKIELFPVGTMVRNKINNLSVPENVRR